MVREKTQKYLLWLFPKINGFPNKQKFLLGERIGTTALDILGLIISLQFLSQEERKKILGKFNLKLEYFRELMRLAWKLNFLSQRSFFWQENQINEIGRMVWGMVGKKMEASSGKKSNS